MFSGTLVGAHGLKSVAIGEREKMVIPGGTVEKMGNSGAFFCRHG